MTPVPTTPQDIRLTPIAHMAMGGRWRVEAMRSYSSDLLLWFTRGQGRITVAGRTRGYGAHNAIFVPSGTMHGFDMSAAVFGTALFLPRGASLDLPADALHMRIRESAPQRELTGLLESLQRELDGDLPGNERAAFHYAGLFAVWLQRAQALYPAENGGTDKTALLAARFTEMIESEFRSGRTVTDYARALGITPTHLSRVCNQACGRSASALLTDRILYEARRLLAETRLPVHQVAAQLGYTSAAYFSRAFQHQVGETPSAFRRQN